MKSGLSHNGAQLYQIGQFQLDTDERSLLRDGVPVPITPKMFDLLWMLVSNSGRIVEKDDLMQSVWSGSFVEESNLTVTIRQLRKALNDDAQAPSYIQTVARRGYRFVAPVEMIEERTMRPRIPAGAAVDTSKSPAAGINGNGTYDPSTEEAPSSNIVPSVAPEIKRFSPAARVSLIVAAILLVASAGAYYFWSNRHQTLASRLTTLRVEKLSDTGDSSGANISPDGKLIAYSTVEAGKPVIWIRQLTTGKSLQILPMSDDTIIGISFSNDGEHLYYLHSKDGAFSDLSKISILGGAPTKILSQVHTGFAFSPDGKKVVFIRSHERVSSIALANSDGSGEQTLLTAPTGQSIASLDWAPDGNSFAYTALRSPAGERDFVIIEHDLASGTDRQLSDFAWNHLDGIMWLSDKSGMLASGRDSANGVDQLWLVTLPSGAAQQITADSNSLSLRGATSDFSRILAMQTTLVSNIWVGDASNPSAVRQSSPAQFDLALTKDGSFVFPATDTSGTDIWISNPDGTERRQLTASEAIEQRPVASPDGRFIVYLASLHGRKSIWRIDLDGGNPVQLTVGDRLLYPTFTPDSRFVVYNSLDLGALMKVPIDGGEPVVVFKGRALGAAVSPDGESFAHIGLKDDIRTLFLRNFSDGKLLKEIAIPGRPVFHSKLAWTADGNSILYTVMDEGKVGNIFRQRLNGPPAPEKFTDFTSEQIFDFSLSADGTRIALIRGNWKDDTILLTGLN